MDISDQALNSIRRNNSRIMALVIVTLMVLIAIGGYAVYEIDRLVRQGQSNVEAQAKQNEDLIRELSKSNMEAHITQLEYVQCVTSVPNAMRQPDHATNCLYQVYPDIDQDRN